MNPSLPVAVAVAAAACLQSSGAAASCGASTCSLMTDRYAQGGAEPHAGWSLDLRLESVTQDRLRSGTRRIAPEEALDGEAVERRTRNQAVVLGLGYGFDDHWSMAMRLPLLRRDHLHDLVDEDTGNADTPERWRFTRPGDLRLTVRRQFDREGGAGSWALIGGLDLPTGSHRVANGDGTRAERSLQPGSGSAGLVLGVAARSPLGDRDAWIAQAMLTQALASREGYRPGRRSELSVGWSHAWSPDVGAVLQINLRHHARDRGEQAEPEHSGARSVDLSPGLTLGAGAGSTLYAYLQLPLYQQVNGIQLVPRRALAVGWTRDY